MESVTCQERTEKSARNVDTRPVWRPEWIQAWKVLRTETELFKCDTMHF